MPLPDVLSQLMHYWQALPQRGSRCIPSRFSMLPTDLADITPRLSLLKRESRYQVNVSKVGTSHNTAWQSPLVGMNSFDLIPPNMRENMAKLYAAVLDHPCGVVLTEQYTARSGAYRKVYSLYLPMTDKNDHPHYIIGCSAYEKISEIQPINDRLLPAHEQVTSVEFLDIGAGIPAVEFEIPEQIARQAPLSQTWWARLVPMWAKPRIDTGVSPKREINWNRKQPHFHGRITRREDGDQPDI